MPASVRAVTFDIGQTLLELDTALLSRRLAERGVAVAADALERAVPAAWARYDAAVRGTAGGHPWIYLMTVLLDGAGARGADVAAAVDWLWGQQPTCNLWRRPITGMFELTQAVAAAGLALGVVSNSEGRLAELLAELGWADRLGPIADSGRLGAEKPGRAIFDWTARALGVDGDAIVHVGDSRAADVEGALAAGWRAIWFDRRGDAGTFADERARVARTPTEVRAALIAWGVAL